MKMASVEVATMLIFAALRVSWTVIDLIGLRPRCHFKGVFWPWSILMRFKNFDRTFGK